MALPVGYAVNRSLDEGALDLPFDRVGQPAAPQLDQACDLFLGGPHARPLHRLDEPGEHTGATGGCIHAADVAVEFGNGGHRNLLTNEASGLCSRCNAT